MPRRKGRRWEDSYYDSGGRRRWITAATRRELRRLKRGRLSDSIGQQTGAARSTAVTLRAFWEEHYWPDAVGLKPSTRRTYETLWRIHLLPTFGNAAIDEIGRAVVKKWIARKAQEQRWSYARRPARANPNRPVVSRKTILNAVSLLSVLLQSAAEDYEFIEVNPLRGIRLRRYLPPAAPGRRLRVLEPEEFRGAVERLESPYREMVVFAALTGVSWEEQKGIRIEEVDFGRNVVPIYRGIWGHQVQTPKAPARVREIIMCPTVRRLLLREQARREAGYIFSPDGIHTLGKGGHITRKWRKAQEAAGIAEPVRWHDLRHIFTSLLIAQGKSAAYIAEQLGWSNTRMLDVYGHLLKTVTRVYTEWHDDLIWPEGFHHGSTEVVLEGGRGGSLGKRGRI